MAQSNSQQSGGGSRLQNTFANRPVEDHGAGWSSLWDEGSSGLWDRGMTSPALVDILEKERELLNPFTPDGQRKKALVPGCGRGYEVVMLALHGFDAYGLEISTTAVKEAESYAAAEMANPSAYHFCSEQTQQQRSDSPGTATFLEGDFFSTAWESKGGINGNTQFDLAYDYTFLCALHPTQRKDWATNMARVLKPKTGLLICLEFPMYKDPKLPGPPWGLKGVHWNLLTEGREGLVTGEVGDDGIEGETGPHNGDFRRLIYVRPARSYKVAKGTDMLSVWARK